MKTIALLVAIALTVSVCFATQTGHGELRELNFSLEGLPVYVKDAIEVPDQSSVHQYKLDTTVLVFLIKQNVDPHGWNNQGPKIESSTVRGRNVLRIVQTQVNQEKIAELLSKLRKASPHYVEKEEEFLGVSTKK
jgi:hypothetical protein